jgi:hypothetical protein
MAKLLTTLTKETHSNGARMLRRPNYVQLKMVERIGQDLRVLKTSIPGNSRSDEGLNISHHECVAQDIDKQLPT